MIPETITIAEAMERYKCDRKAITTAIHSEIVKAYKPGKAIQVDIQSADDWYFSTKIVKKTGPGRPRRGAKR